MYLVTANPPTPNGDLHVGHLAGPFVAADVFCRFQRMRGHEAVYLSSSDGHQSFVVTTAARLGMEPAELVASSNATIEATLEAVGAEVGCFTNAVGDAKHIALVQRFFRELYDREIVVPKTHESHYCNRCERFLFESFVSGRCAYCGGGASGNLCEACGRVYDPLKLIDPTCTVCGDSPSRAEYRGLFLPLERHRAALQAHYAERTDWRPHLRAYCEALLEEPLDDYPVSYPTSWGVPVPIEGFEGQAINVWLEMYPGYVHTTRTWAERQGDPELADRLWAGDATLVQFLGFDNSFCNAVLHVAVALALDREWLVPEHVMTNEFYLLEGRKFSTSQDHAIWGGQILETVDPDALRYHVARTNPEQWQTNFARAEFDRTSGEELGGRWSEAIEAALAASAGRDLAGAAGDTHVDGLLAWASSALGRSYDVGELSLRASSATLSDLVDAIRWHAGARAGGSPEQARAAAAGSASLLKGLALLSSPLMPSFAQRLWERLGLEGRVADQPWGSVRAPAEGPVPAAEPSPWFAESERPLATL